EGTLTPGPHLFSVRKGSLGTAPAMANVVEEQTVVINVKGVPLGAELVLVAEPQTAEVSIDGVAVAKGSWRGALPLGRHVFEAREIGFITARVTREETLAPNEEVPLHLAIDRSHPRWAIARPPPGILRVDLFGGAALATSFGGDADASCGSHACSGDALA